MGGTAGIQGTLFSHAELAENPGQHIIGGRDPHQLLQRGQRELELTGHDLVGVSGGDGFTDPAQGDTGPFERGLVPGTGDQ